MKISFKGTILIVMLSGGCSDMNSGSSKDNSEEIPDEYVWLKDADVEKDIKSFVVKGDFRLIAIANRGNTIIGLTESDDRALLTTQCGVRFLSGLGDTITPGEDKTWRDKALEYASAFNALMKDICLEK